MSRNLEYAVRGGIDYEISALQMLLSEVADNVGSGVGKVEKRASARSFFKLLDNLLREAFGIGGQGAW